MGLGVGVIMPMLVHPVDAAKGDFLSPYYAPLSQVCSPPSPATVSSIFYDLFHELVG